MTRGTEWHDPARAAPVSRVINIAVHRQRHQDEAIRPPRSTLLWCITIATGSHLRWIEERRQFREDPRQGMAWPRMMHLVPGPRMHIITQALPEFSDRPTQG